MSILKNHSLSLLIVLVFFAGCQSNPSTVQMDRSASSTPKGKTAKFDQKNNDDKSRTLVSQTADSASVKPKLIESELDKTQNKKNPISKLIGKFSSKPKRITLPRTDLKSSSEKESGGSFTQKEEDISEEEISF